ncbi:MAG: MBL fold metallo-hydrolase, partial [Gammaproteobacteria bacterium]
MVTDSYQHGLLASGKFGDVTVQRFASSAPLNVPLPRMLLSEWGLALHLESSRGTESRRFLVDFGFTGTTLNHNLQMLGIDPGKLDAMLLTHGHYDHFGGMVGFLTAHAKAFKPDLPFYVGGEECFCSREVGPPNAPVNFGAMDRKAIADSGVRLTFAEKPSTLAGHGFTTGSIPQVSFEKPAQPSRMKVGLQADGMGCAPDALPAERRTLTLVPDDFQHEQATCFNVKGKGLVVLT